MQFHGIQNSKFKSQKQNLQGALDGLNSGYEMDLAIPRNAPF
ncbi:hypothetical protein [Dapis sp. BLCC M229]